MREDLDVTQDEGLERAVVAIERWVAVLNDPSDPAGFGEALAPRARLLRMGVWDQAGQLAERFVGPEAARAWLERAPGGVRFWLDGEVRRDGAAVFVVRYGYQADDFVHGGEWRFELSEDGRVSWLLHRPDPLAPDSGADKDWSGVVEAARQKALAPEVSLEAAPSWRALGPNADLAFELTGPTEESLLEVGARCVVAQLLGEGAEVADRGHVHVSVTATDAAGRLAQLLGEVLRRAVVDGFLTARAQVALTGEGRVKATLHGEPGAHDRVVLARRGVTCHEATLEGARWRGVIRFDA